MDRRTVLIGSAAAGVVATAGIAGFALGARGSLGHWRDAVEMVRRPIASGRSGREALGELVRCATLAANSHNTQAWRFVLGDGSITIAPDFSRRTPVVDPDDHHLFASLGAATENILQAAPAFGLSATSHFGSAGEGSVIIDLRPGDRAMSRLAGAIVERQCTRSLYDGRAVSASDLGALAAAGSRDEVSAILITERPAIDTIAALVVDGNTVQLRDQAFMNELRRWLRFNYGDALSSGDGLFSVASGNPALPPPIGRALFDLAFRPESDNRKYLNHIASSAGLAVFVSERNDKAHWVAAGRAYQRFALQATALGIKHAFLNQAVEVPEMRRRLAEHLALGERRPDLVVRFGYAPTMPWSLRRPLADVLG